MTIRILKKFGTSISFDTSTNVITVNGTGKKIPPTDFTIENDWSAAAFFAVYGTLVKPVFINNLNINSLQGDSIIAEILVDAGNFSELKNNGIVFAPGRKKAINVDLTHHPDLFPPLAVYAAFANGTSILKGINRLKNKESNRTDAIVKEFTKAGINIKIENDEMIINGNSQIIPANLSSYNDHRIAMALTMLGIIGNANITLDNPDCVNKSFPGFFNETTKLKNYG